MDYGSPISYMVLLPGTPVVCNQGYLVGHVNRVLQVPEKDVFDGILIDADGPRFVDAYQVDYIYERAVVLAMAHTEVAQLPRRN
jgi:hypothetical protein